ncbi:hypothetical protein AA313_de0210466 [Arthrobotrys entomopaga]|nr:hypothetical protein AA313_de0210466 [Arthrobotrys entomopaga]
MQLRLSHFLGLILSAGFAAAALPTLKSNAITAPIAGDIITAGKPYTIRWTNTMGASVTLNLIDGPSNQLKSVAEIVSGAPNKGIYTWNVPDDLPTSNTYAIRISYDNNPDDWNYSDRFTFVNQNMVASADVSSAATTTASATMSSASESTTDSMMTTTGSASSESLDKSVTTMPASTETNAITSTDEVSTTTKAGKTYMPTAPAPIDGESNSATRFGGSSGSFAGLVVAMVGVIVGGAFIVV